MLNILHIGELSTNSNFTDGDINAFQNIDNQSNNSKGSHKAFRLLQFQLKFSQPLNEQKRLLDA